MNTDPRAELQGKWFVLGVASSLCLLVVLVTFTAYLLGVLREEELSGFLKKLSMDEIRSEEEAISKRQ